MAYGTLESAGYTLTSALETVAEDAAAARDKAGDCYGVLIRAEDEFGAEMTLEVHQQVKRAMSAAKASYFLAETVEDAVAPLQEGKRCTEPHELAANLREIAGQFEKGTEGSEARGIMVRRLREIAEELG